MLTFAVELTIGIRKNDNTKETEDLSTVPVFEANPYAAGLIQYLEIINSNGDDINGVILPSYPIQIPTSMNDTEIEGIYTRRFLVPVIVTNCTSVDDLPGRIRDTVWGAIYEGVKGITDYDLLFNITDESCKVTAINYNSYVMLTRQEITRYTNGIKQELANGTITEDDVSDITKLNKNLEYHCTLGTDNGYYRLKSLNCLDETKQPYYDLLLHRIHDVIDSIDEEEGFQYKYPTLTACPFNIEMRSISSIDGERLFRYHLTKLARRGLITTENYAVIHSEMFNIKSMDVDELVRMLNYGNLYIIMDELETGVRLMTQFLSKLSQRCCICINWINVPTNIPNTIFKDNAALDESIIRFLPNRFSMQSKGRVFTTIGEDIPIDRANQYIIDTYTEKAKLFDMDYYEPILIDTPNHETIVTDLKLKETCHHNDIRLMMNQYADNTKLYQFLRDSSGTMGFDDLPISTSSEDDSKGTSFKHILGKIFKSNTSESTGYESVIPRKPETVETNAMDKLDALIGLTDVKKTLKDIVSVVRANKKYKELGIKPLDKYFHMVFYGNPGTAKTTVGRLCASIFAKEGLIKNNKYTELGRADLVGQYVGHTADKVVKCFERGRGGVIFIDEAYSLISTHESDYGREAINTIVQLLEDYREDTIVIFAGYGKPMDRLIDMNPGLRSRISYNLQFKDYTEDELLDILSLQADEYKFILDDEFIEEFKQHVRKDMHKKEFGNGRYVRDVFQRSIVVHSSNIMNIENVSDDRIKTITKEDYPTDVSLSIEDKRVGFR